MSADEAADLSTRVQQESAKRAAKKAAQTPPRRTAGGVKVVMLTGSRNVPAGATRTLDKGAAAALILQGHARKA